MSPLVGSVITVSRAHLSLNSLELEDYKWFHLENYLK